MEKCFNKVFFPGSALNVSYLFAGFPQYLPNKDPQYCQTMEKQKAVAQRMSATRESEHSRKVQDVGVAPGVPAESSETIQQTAEQQRSGGEGGEPAAGPAGEHRGQRPGHLHCESYLYRKRISILQIQYSIRAPVKNI